MSLLNVPVLSRVRRNHGLEHATIHMLSRQPGRSVAGHSDSGGFWILGDVGTEELAAATTEALARLRNGEHGLAIHPNCGTVFATQGIAAGLGAFIALWGAKRNRDRLERLPLAALFATVGIMLAQPLGHRLQQRVTTSGVPGDLQIMDILRTQQGNFTAHRVTTRG